MVREGKVIALAPPPTLASPAHMPPDGRRQEEPAAAAGPGGQAAAEGQGLQAPGRGGSEFMVSSTHPSYVSEPASVHPSVRPGWRVCYSL